MASLACRLERVQRQRVAFDVPAEIGKSTAQRLVADSQCRMDLVLVEIRHYQVCHRLEGLRQLRKIRSGFALDPGRPDSG